MATVYLNGAFVPKERAVVPVDDRGFVFGDGIYEVVRVIEGRIFAWAEHAQRMARGLGEVRIGFSARDVAALEAVCERLLADNDLMAGEATVYLQVTRGVAPRLHHFPPAGTAPTVYAAASRFTPSREMRERGIAAILLPDIRWARCDVKTVNLMGAVLARQSAREAGAYEALLIRDGMLTEGAATNAFVVMDGVVRTYPLSNYILPGVTRRHVIDAARDAGVPVVEEPVTQQQLLAAPEVFVAGTTTDVAPVVAIDGRPVGDGTPGALTRKVQAAFLARLYESAPVAR
ncbi:MAG TPA: D-amino-acid transaminase [Gemmatimonadaceae bacterium]|nr:D-amino-acid transaminase [Gemmatimonadaceae bacterium]